MINAKTIARIGRQQVLLRQLQEQAKQVATVRQPALVDSFNRPHTYLRISITERCNLRCQYCMPLEGVNLTPKAELLTENEIVRLAELFAEQGVNKIRFTGGEPLVSPQIVQLIERIKKIDGIDTIALTTNAVTLARKLPELVDAGLDAVNISLDTMVPQKFAFITRRPARTLQKILKGVDAALNSNLKSVKLNTVVMKGLNEDELCDFVALTKDSPLSVRFLEFMPFSGNAWENKKFIPFTAQKELIEEQFGKLEKRNDVPTSTSMNYGVEGHVGSVGFISSMSRNFCGGCNRLRLTHDGMLKVCLFGKDEVSLRDALRSNSANCEEDLLEAIHGAVKRKKYSHGGLSNIQSEMKRPMILIDDHRGKPLQAFRGLKTLSHLDSKGQARMVDVSAKPPSVRCASAVSAICLSRDAYSRVCENSLAKGDVLSVARIAGIQAAKLTFQLIPLCHQIPLDKVEILYKFPEALSHDDGAVSPDGEAVSHDGEAVSHGDEGRFRIQIFCNVRCFARTGVEMEAMVGCSIAALTVYDMCKAVDKGAVIVNTRLVEKSGGKSGHYKAQ